MGVLDSGAPTWAPTSGGGLGMTTRSRGALELAARATFQLWTALPTAAAKAAVEYGRGGAALLKAAASEPPPPPELPRKG